MRKKIMIAAGDPGDVFCLCLVRQKHGGQSVSWERGRLLMRATAA